MKTFRWDHAKNDLLKREWNISFEEITLAIEAGGLLDEVAHPNAARYPQQHILVVAYENYVYLIPYIEEADHYFLKTIIPSRKATKHFLGQHT